MPVFLSTPGRRVRVLAVALLAGTLACVATAAPSDDVDPLAKLMADTATALTPSYMSGSAPTAPELFRQVRDKATGMADSAMNFIGVSYRRGGQTAETGFDCSGFTRYVFEMSGLLLPRRADEQATDKALVPVKKEDLKPGDLVFFNTMRRTFSHVGIYIGENRFIHAPSRGKTVRTDDLGFAYWAKRFTGARRAESLGDTAASTEPSKLAGTQASVATAVPPAP